MATTTMLQGIAKEHNANFREWDFMTSITMSGRQWKTSVNRH
jgi:hypothetical protein